MGIKQETENGQDIRLAVLIDADNISASHLAAMMQEIARYGNPTIKRVYGDWTRPNLGAWKQALNNFAITPVQQFGYTTGKNSTDSALIIDAMDILYSERTEGFCLVSSDSDFTRLATRLREAGKIVYGIGEQKTPNAFIAACDKFIYLEILADPEAVSAGSEADAGTLATDTETAPDPLLTTTDAAKSSGSGKSSRTRRRKTIRRLNPETEQLISSTIQDCEDENGWAFLGAVGSLLLKKQPSFDSRNYGFDKLTPLIKSMGRYEIDVREAANSTSKHVYIRDKRAQH